jgi:hypothetical protein
MAKEPTPTPEDRARVRHQIEHARETMEEILVRAEARRRVERERRERRWRLLRRLLPFRRSA